MDNKKIARVITLLHEKAMGYELNWSNSETNVYQLSFANSSISISKEFDRESQDDYVSLKFYNISGELVLEIHGGNLPNYLNETYKYLEEIYNAAKEHLLNADGTLDDVLNSLESSEKDTKLVNEDDLPF
jgi:hypothetical protein